MRRLALSLLLLLALFLLGWWAALDPDVGDEGALAPVDRDATAHDVAPPVRIGVSDEETPAPRLVGTGSGEPARAGGAFATLRCRVLGPDGAPRTGSVVQLEREELVDPPAGAAVPPGFAGVQTIRHVRLGHRWTDTHGCAVFSNLPPHRYRVVALAPPGLLAAQADVDLGAADHDLVLGYRRTVDARIEVLDSAGMPVAHAGVTLLRAHTKGANTNEHGVAVLAELDPDWDVALRIRPPSNLDLFEQTVDPWPLRDTRVVLERGLSVSGRVVDEVGEPVPKARVHRRAEGDSWATATAGNDGRFRFRGLRAGDELTLRVGPPGSWAGAVTEAVTVEAGTDDLSVVLPHGAVLEVVVPGWPEDARGSIRLTTTSKAPILRTARIEQDGHCTFRYLDPRDVHVLWGVLLGDERFLYRSRVRAQEEPLEVGLQEGEAIHVRVELPEGVLLRAVDASGPGIHRRAVLVPGQDGPYRIPPLPAGRWTVRALGTSFGPPPRGQGSWIAEAVAQPGDHIELTLEPTD